MTINKRTKKFLAGGLAILAASFLAVLFLATGDKPSFQRLKTAPGLQDTQKFTLAPGQGLLFYQAQGQERQLLNFPSGDSCFFEVQKEKKVEFVSPFSGTLGFFCQFYLQGMEGGKVRLQIECLQAGRSWELLQSNDKKPYFRFIRQLRLASGDRIRFTFAGKGIACFSPPIFYRMRQAQERQYVFLIGVDTLRGDHVGMKVKGRSITPRLDRFKRDAVTFSSCFAQSNWTLPSFMSLFTAQYEFNHQVRHGGVLGEEKPFLIKELRRRFITVNLNAGGNVSKNFGFSRYFDHFISSPRYGDANGGQVLFRDALRLVDAGMFPAAFYFLHTYQVHTPFSPPPRFLHEINPEARTEKLNSVTYGSQRKRFMPVAAELTQSYRELYQAEVLAFDRYFGDFLDALKKRGIYDNSMVIVMSDHGEEFFEHGGWGHGHSMYEELLRVPLIIKFPGGKSAGRQVDEPAGVIDILPSLLDYYGIAASGEKVDGISLLPLLRGKKLPRERLFSSVSACWYIRQLPARLAVIDGRRKVICNYVYRDKALKFFGEYGLPPRSGPIEIFDLDRDRGETRNLYPEDDAYRRLRHVIEAIKKRIGANLKMKDKGRKASMDDELRKQMKTLGYL